MIARQSTALTVSVGPILDASGVEYTGAVIGDLTITKNGTSAAMASAATLTHTSNGHYDLVMTTGNTDTCGQTTVRCNKSTYQMPRLEFNVVEEVVYDALFAASAPGYLQPTTAGRTLDVSTGGEAGIDWANIGSPTASVSLSNTSVDLIADAVDSTTIANNAITSAKIATDAIGAAQLAADAIGSSELAASAVAEIKAALDTTAMTESYAANGAAPTKEQALFAIHQMLMQFAISSTSLTVKKLDNSTTAFVVTLDSSTAPTAAART